MSHDGITKLSLIKVPCIGGRFYFDWSYYCQSLATGLNAQYHGVLRCPQYFNWYSSKESSVPRRCCWCGYFSMFYLTTISPAVKPSNEACLTWYQTTDSVQRNVRSKLMDEEELFCSEVQTLLPQSGEEDLRSGKRLQPGQWQDGRSLAFPQAEVPSGGQQHRVPQVERVDIVTGAVHNIQ